VKVFSVVVCTYNRSNVLSTALDTLLDQSIDPSLYEVIVVDNNSTDKTKEVVLDYATKDDRVKYVLEEKVGLSHARNRGLIEASGDYIVYTDDDCELPKEWLYNAYGVFQQMRPAMMGGPVHPYYLDGTKPLWYKDLYIIKEYGTIGRPLNENEYLIGCNFFVRKDLPGTIGDFDADYGMTGGKIGYAEETELQERMRRILNGEIIYYDPKLFVRHLVRPEQMTLKWIIKSFYSKGKNNYLLRNKGKTSVVKASRWELVVRLMTVYFVIGCHVFYGVILRDRKKYPSFNNYCYEKIQGHIKKLGYYVRQW